MNSAGSPVQSYSPQLRITPIVAIFVLPVLVGLGTGFPSCISVVFGTCRYFWSLSSMCCSVSNALLVPRDELRTACFVVSSLRKGRVVYCLLRRVGAAKRPTCGLLSSLWRRCGRVELCAACFVVPRRSSRSKFSGSIDHCRFLRSSSLFQRRAGPIRTPTNPPKLWLLQFLC